MLAPVAIFDTVGKKGISQFLLNNRLRGGGTTNSAARAGSTYTYQLRVKPVLRTLGCAPMSLVPRTKVIGFEYTEVIESLLKSFL